MKISLSFLALLAVVSLPPADAAPSEKRLALVIGNASYKARNLATPVNDAALIAQTLRAAGFDVTGARDLGGEALRRAFRDFFDSVTKAGPDAVAAVYFAGYGIQLEGENYLVPIDADITEVSQVPLRAVRLSEQMHALGALHLKAAFMILDVARVSPFLLSGQPPASGLAWVEPETNVLIAFNAAPGTVSPDVGDGYGPYAEALAEMIREGGLTPANMFDRVRLRVNELTKGAQVPWFASKIEAPFVFLERGAGAPSRADSPEHTAWMRSQPMRSLGVRDAYLIALMRDTFDAYTDFLADYWRDPMTKRVRALLAVRREAITWRRTYLANVPDAYWSYLERYPRGPHVADARRLLAHLGAATALPAKFARMEYDVPPPLPDELEYIARTVLVFDDPAFAFAPLPPSPVHFLEPPPPELLTLAAPAAPSGANILPTPMFVPLPAYVDVPAYVAAPPNSSISDNALKTPVISNANNLPDSSRLPSSVATKPTPINSRTPPPLGSNPVARQEIKVPPGPPVPAATPLWATLDPAARQESKASPSSPVSTVSLMPLWATDNRTPASPGLRSPASPGSAPSIPVPTLLAPPPAGRSAVLPPRTNGGVPMPVARPATSAPAGNRPKPIGQATSMLPPAAVDQRQPASPLSRPPVAVGVSSPKPQGKPCPVVNGKRSCG